MEAKVQLEIMVVREPQGVKESQEILVVKGVKEFKEHKDHMLI
jgi:hypothetical protein